MLEAEQCLSTAALFNQPSFQTCSTLKWILQKRLLGISEADLFTYPMSLLSPNQALPRYRIVHTAKVLTLHVSAKKTLTVLSRSEIANSFWSALQHTSGHRHASTLCHNRQYQHWTRANVITASCRKHGTKGWWKGSDIGLRSKAQRFDSSSAGNDSGKVVHTFVSLSPSSIICTSKWAVTSSGWEGNHRSIGHVLQTLVV